MSHIPSPFYRIEILEPFRDGRLGTAINLYEPRILGARRAMQEWLRAKPCGTVAVVTGRNYQDLGRWIKRPSDHAIIKGKS